ncbi:MAG TPA: glutamate cyclase domain-containing protein [Allosphingosinicella sp.]|nr:glutamate cyclase domain-containing protein [Allosphingosinicella sp.]
MAAEADPARLIWDSVVAASGRGMPELEAVVGIHAYRNAAEALLASTDPVVVGTGFPVNGAPETDGPPGAFVIADALLRLGREVSVATWAGAEAILRQARPRLDYLTVPIERGAPPPPPPPGAGGRVLVTVEACGMIADGRYQNMRGEDISAAAPKFESFFGPRSLISIGDGGNEFGMGGIPLSFFEDRPFERPISTTDHLLPAATSNYGAYALVCYLERLTGEPLLPQREDHLELIRELVRLGCVDGISGERRELVDGRPLAESGDILDLLQEVAAGAR